MKNKVKKVRKMLPCPAYDIERVESWLGDMGREGLLLDKKHYAGSAFLRFVPCRPQNIRYRLEPKVKGMENNWEPPEEARALAAEYGWEFVCVFEMFYVYRTVRADAPEMNTDNLVQAASLKRLKKDLIISLLWQTVSVAYVLFGFIREAFRFFVTFGSIYVVLFLLFFTGMLLTDIRRLEIILRLRKKLKQNIPMDHSRDWRKGAKLHKSIRLSVFLISMLAILTFFSTMFRTMSSPKADTGDYPGDPPFLTVADLYPGYGFQSAGLDGMYNYYQRLDSDLCREMIDWREFVKIQVKEGKEIGTATMIVEYYDTASHWLAKGLAMDFIRRDAQWKGIDSLERLPDPDLGLDYVFTYNEILPTMVIQHGNIMVKATLSKKEDLYRWAEGMSEMLK